MLSLAGSNSYTSNKKSDWIFFTQSPGDPPSITISNTIKHYVTLNEEFRRIHSSAYDFITGRLSFFELEKENQDKLRFNLFSKNGFSFSNRGEDPIGLSYKSLRDINKIESLFFALSEKTEKLHQTKLQILKAILGKKKKAEAYFYSPNGEYFGVFEVSNERYNTYGISYVKTSLNFSANNDDGKNQNYKQIKKENIVNLNLGMALNKITRISDRTWKQRSWLRYHLEFSILLKIIENHGAINVGIHEFTTNKKKYVINAHENDIWDRRDMIFIDFLNSNKIYKHII